MSEPKPTPVPKYDGRGSHRRAILHMIGQSQIIKGRPVKVSEVAQWMNLSKQTASRYIWRLVDSGEIVIYKNDYKRTGEINHIELVPEIMTQYLDGWLINDYQHWMADLAIARGLM